MPWRTPTATTSCRRRSSPARTRTCAVRRPTHGTVGDRTMCATAWRRAMEHLRRAGKVRAAAGAVMCSGMVEGGGLTIPLVVVPVVCACSTAPVGAVGMYGGHLSTMDAYRARMSDMTALTASLMVKREQMMQQVCGLCCVCALRGAHLPLPVAAVEGAAPCRARQGRAPRNRTRNDRAFAVSLLSLPSRCLLT